MKTIVPELLILFVLSLAFNALAQTSPTPAKPAAPVLTDAQKLHARELMLTDSNYAIQLYQMQLQADQTQQKKRENAASLADYSASVCPSSDKAKFQLNYNTLQCDEVKPQPK